MIKIPVYIRIAKNVRKKGNTPVFRFSISPKPSLEPIYKKFDAYYHKPKQPLSTIQLGISIVLPDDAFEESDKIVAEIDFRATDIEVACKVPKGVRVEIKKHALKQLQK